MSDLTEEYERRTPESRRLFEEAGAVMPGGDTREVTYFDPYPTFVEEASGCTLTTADGEELLDFLNNYTQAVLGHAPPAVVEAVTERFARGNGFAAPTREATDLAERIVERTPSVESVRFANSGTEATMNAVRAAIAHTGNDHVLKLDGAFHGTHDTVLVGVTGDGRENPGIPRNVEERVSTVPFNDADALVEAFERLGDDLACFIVDPIMGNAGVIPPRHDYLETARDLTEDADTLLVFDEVMTYRLAEGGAQERYGVTPDLTAFGKFIGGGLPCGAFGGREDVMAVFDPVRGSVTHSGTFNGNPTTMAGGLATLDALDADAIDRINDLGATARDRLDEVCADADLPVQVTGDGSFFNVHFTDEEVVDAATSTTGHESSGGPTEQFFLALRNRGVFVARRGLMNVSTPMGDAEIDALVDAFEAALSDVAPAVAAEVD
ncbi:aspartate aminotransferase family protein [Halorarum halophilum]|uniref:Glutamate-1-semialdehyde 2,1-aminomutase n=1 Tax=Halorarum halophilum TaxID=2743090 RepID=A0A7D5GBC4_9EURY|nr:aspartate aminotransferase family protein [Halobaculum halophilum]QLG27332.1 aspartate aminotransferase family protein [Halobaculum halophilum]